MSLRGVSVLRGASCCPEIHIFISSSGIFNIITAAQTVSAIFSCSSGLGRQWIHDHVSVQELFKQFAGIFYVKMELRF